MEKFDDNFLEFLKAYEPSDFYKVVDGNAKPEVLTHIYDDHKKKFAAWLKVPPPLRHEYGGRVPDEILAYAEAGNIQALRNIARDKPAEPSLNPQDVIPDYQPPSLEELALTSTFAMAITSGYMKEAAKDLAINQNIREQLLKGKSAKPKLNDEERKLWKETRHKDGDLGGTMRLGAYPCVLEKNSKAYEIYGTETISERHRHRYEVNMRYEDVLKKAGMVITGKSPDGLLPEIVEIPEHPWFVAVQFHPELKSKPFAPAPLVVSFIKAAIDKSRLL